MAEGLCSEYWRTTEDLTTTTTRRRSNPRLDVTFPPQQYWAPATVPFGLSDSSSSSLDQVIAHHLPLLDHLAFDGDPLLAPHDPFDVDVFSRLFPSSYCPSATRVQWDRYIAPSDLACGGNPFGTTGLLFETAATADTMSTGVTSHLEPEGTAAAVVGFSSGSREKKTAPSWSGGDCPSANGAAARERRRRIREKTHELGQLIPGGYRMNTAEMLHAAFKYVRFLQAQIGMLDVEQQLEGWPSSREAPPRSQLLQGLLVSPAVHEKLAAGDMCVVPTWVVRALAEDGGIMGHTSISGDLSMFMVCMGRSIQHSNHPN